MGFAPDQTSQPPSCTTLAQSSVHSSQLTNCSRLYQGSLLIRYFQVSILKIHVGHHPTPSFPAWPGKRLLDPRSAIWCVGMVCLVSSHIFQDRPSSIDLLRSHGVAIRVQSSYPLVNSFFRSSSGVGLPESRILRAANDYADTCF